MGFWSLAGLSLAMAAGSFVAGLVPLSIPVSAARLVLVSTFGAGLLLGTGLAVILPEGVAALAAAHELASVKKSSESPFPLPLGAAVDVVNAQDSKPPWSPERVLGIALLSGFAFMFLVEQGGALVARERQRGQSSRKIVVSEMSTSASNGGSGLLPGDDDKSPMTRGSSSKDINDYSLPNGFSGRGHYPEDGVPQDATVLGLVIHSTADGIALGAASLSGQESLSIVVFLALLLHKAPAAFGLSSVLLLEGLARRAIKTRLLIFSLSAPVTALLTFALLKLQHFEIGEGGELVSQSSSGASFWAGTALLFSAGTFLYVATLHVLPEVLSGRGGDSGSGHHNHGYRQSSGSHSHHHLPHGGDSRGTVLPASHVLALLVGMVTPLILSAGHSHGHHDH